MTRARPSLVRASDWAWRVLVLLALGAIAVYAGILLSAIVVPALLAVVVVPVGRPLEERLARRLPDALAAALVMLVAVVVLMLAAWMMIASIAANWDALWAGISDAIASLVDWMDDSIGDLDAGQLGEIEENLKDLAGTIAGVLLGGAGRGIAIIGAFFMGLFFFLVTFFFGLKDWDRFETWLLRRTKLEYREQGTEFLARYDDVMRRYWKSQALIGVFDALAIGIGLWLIGVPLALPVAILTFVISFIPYLGAIISGTLAVLIALGTGGAGDALLALLLSLLVFNTGENLVRPWLVGETVKMPTFLAFIASTVGVLVAGALGAILAIPLVALITEARRIYLPDPEDDPEAPTRT